MFRGLLNYIGFSYSSQLNSDDDPIDHIWKLPNEILTQILDYLPMEEKLRAVLVCKKWKSQVDENVSFDVYLTDKNFNQVGRRLQARRVRSLHISNYSHPTIPIEELFPLKNLDLANNVNEQAIRILFTRAITLNSLVVKLHRRPENNSKESSLTNKQLPALLSLKKLTVGYEWDRNWNSQTDLLARSQAWHKVLDEQMPNLEILNINLLEGMFIPPIRGFNFFRLISSKPKLRRLLLLQVPKVQVRLTDPLTSNVCEGLRSLLKLTHVAGIVLEKDEPAWNLLLSGQQCLESITLSCEWGVSCPTQGFSMSMVRQVLKRCSESLRTVSLVIDTQRNGSVLDMKIFAEIKSIRDLYLKVWMRENYRRKPQANVLNCSTVITHALRRLYISDFEVLEEDANNVIKKIAKLDMMRIEINAGSQSTWNNFEQRVREMGMDTEVQVICPAPASRQKLSECLWHHVDFEFMPR